MDLVIYMLKQIQEIFISTLNKIKKIVMGFTANHLEGQSPQIDTPLSPNQLTVMEIEVLLSMIKRTTFLGEDIEPLYNLVNKLQNQHIEQSK
jgi:glutathione peroxidase-family protein